MKKSLLLCSAVLGLMIAVPSFAADSMGSGFTVGVLGGIGAYNNNQGTDATFGVDAMYRVMPDLDAGLYLTLSPLASVSFTNPFTGDTVSASSKLWVIDAQAFYHLNSVAQGLKVGAKAGLGIFSQSNGSDSTSSSKLDFGPAVGYDYALNGGFSVGGEANLLFVTSDPSITDFNVLATVKYSF